MSDTEIERVNHPDHYNWIEGVECIDVAEQFSFALGNAMKYIWRAESPTRSTPEAIVDLRKAAFYIQRRIDQLNAFWEENGPED